MFALYITHPQVRMDPAVAVPKWSLSETGAARSRLAASRPWAGQLGRFISSDEVKAIETAELLAGPSGAHVEVIEDMHENDRCSTGFLPPVAFERAADWFFAHPTESFHGWERAVDAQARIVSNVEAILRLHDPEVPIAFVGHGGVGTLLKCHLEKRPIARQGDQPPGGGNLFCFRLADRVLSCDWTPIEDWPGWVEQ